MRKMLAAAALAAGLAVGSVPAFAAPVAVGDTAPDFEGKEFIGINGPVSLKSLSGKVVFVEIFRTW